MGISSTNRQIHSATYNVKVKPDSSNICKVTYNYNGGSGSPKEDFVPIGTSIVLPTPTRTGYRFDAWYDKDGTKIGYAGTSYKVTSNITLYAHWKRELSASEMMDNFEKSNYLSDNIDMKNTLISIGRALVKYGYEAAFIAGFLGYITHESNIGLFNGMIGSINNMTIEEIKRIVADTDRAFGCCQWREGRTKKLLQLYDENHTGNSLYYSYNGAAIAEEQMIHFELTTPYTDPETGIYNYTFVHPEWIEDCEAENISVDSERAADLAGYRILIGYGLSKYRRYESEIPSWIPEAETRGNYASDIYKVMAGLSV